MTEKLNPQEPTTGKELVELLAKPEVSKVLASNLREMTMSGLIDVYKNSLGEMDVAVTAIGMLAKRHNEKVNGTQSNDDEVKLEDYHSKTLGAEKPLLVYKEVSGDDTYFGLTKITPSGYFELFSNAELIIENQNGENGLELVADMTPEQVELLRQMYQNQVDVGIRLIHDVNLGIDD